MIRLFKKSDSVQCSRIMNTCHKNMEELGEKELAYVLKKYTSEYFSKESIKHYVLVCEKDNKICGLGGLNGVEIRWVYVDPDFQKRGCGKALMDELEKEAKRRKYKKLIVKSYFSAESFYRTLGFKIVNKAEKKLCDATFNYYNMEKFL